MRLTALLSPRSVAVVGASEKPTIGRRLIASLDRIGFTGAIYPVNPGYQTVAGRRCYASVAELPEAPDVAAFCVGHERVLDPFRAAAERGVRAAVIYDGGFAERGKEGWRRQSHIEGICREAGIEFVSLTEPMRQAAAAGEVVYSPEDSHWNAAGHALVARVLADVARSPRPVFSPEPMAICDWFC